MTPANMLGNAAVVLHAHGLHGIARALESTAERPGLEWETAGVAWNVAWAAVLEAERFAAADAMLLALYGPDALAPAAAEARS